MNIKTNLEKGILKLCSPGKILRTKTHLRFFKVGNTRRDHGTYIIKSSEIRHEINDRVFITLNDDWVLKFNVADFDSKWGRDPEINKYIEILGN